MSKITFSLLVGFFLAGCASRMETVKIICPKIQKVTPSSERKLAGELLKMPDDSATIQYILEYKKLRAELRACQHSTDMP